MPAEPLQILIHISRILDSLGICYLTGGSIASSIYGIPRATQDIDLVIDLPPARARDLVAALQPDFYIDSDAVVRAAETGSTFNAIHFETVQKIDFFIRGRDEYAVEEMRRRLKIAIDETGQQTVFVASPEDIILQKLKWFKMGSGVSERQWNDILGVLKVQSTGLDRAYLLRWGKALNIEALLQKAFLDAE